MAWNRPSESKVEKKGGAGQGKLRLAHGLIGAAVVVLGSVVALSLFDSGDASRSVQAPGVRARGAIREVSPASAPRAERPPETPPEPHAKKDEGAVIGSRGLPIPTHGRKIVKDERGVWRFESGQRVFDPNRPLEKLTVKSMEAPKIFAHSSENEIAALINVEPGGMIMENTYDEDFVADFRKSLENEIRASEDDSEHVRNVKDAVAEVKKDLLARLNRGEDIAKYMTDVRNDLCNLHMYREELRKQVADLLDDGESVADKDVGDLIAAANVMLRDKGIRELEDNEFVRQTMILERKEMEREIGAQAEAGGAER